LIPSASIVVLLGVAMILNPIFFAVAFVVVGSAYVAALTIAAAVIDIFATTIRRRGAPLPAPVATTVEETLQELARRGSPRISVAKMRVLASDVTMGAHVRGTVVPRVMVSGGLLVGLSRRVDVASAILCHELAHVAARDKFFLALIFLWIGNSLLSLGAPFFSDPYGAEAASFDDNPGLVLLVPFLNILVTALVLSRMSIRREYMADTYASVLCGKDAYAACLAAASGAHAYSGGFFHPNVKDRLNALSQSLPPGLHASGLIITFYGVSALPRLYDFFISGNTYSLATTAGPVLGIFSEWLRGMLFAFKYPRPETN
jgi:Zn-dependent protease with chaperone function